MTSNPRISRTSRPFTTGDPTAAPGSLEWVRWVFAEAKAALKDASVAREHVHWQIEALRRDNHFRQLTNVEGRNFFIWEAFCTTPQPHGLGYSQEAIDAIVAGRASISVQDRAVQAQPEPTPGGDRRSEAARENQGSRSTLIGRASDYRVARIARDRPDILARMKAGEFPSVRQAAQAAGIVKKRVSVETSALGFIRAAFAQLSPDERAQVIDGLGGQLKEDPNRGEAGPLPERTRQGVLIGSDRPDPAALAGPRMLKDPTVSYTHLTLPTKRIV